MACEVGSTTRRFPSPAPTAAGGSGVSVTHSALVVGSEGTCGLAALATKPTELEGAMLGVTRSKGEYPSGTTGGTTAREAWGVSDCSSIREGG